MSSTTGRTGAPGSRIPCRSPRPTRTRRASRRTSDGRAPGPSGHVPGSDTETCLRGPYLKLGVFTHQGGEPRVGRLEGDLVVDLGPADTSAGVVSRCQRYGPVRNVQAAEV